MGKILVVEDNDCLRGLAKHILVEMGYEVETAVNGFEGLHKWRSGDFDAVVSDINMPVMDGEEMLRQMLSEDKDVKLLFVTGNKPTQEGYYRVLYKPYDACQLQDSVAEMLHEKLMCN